MASRLDPRSIQNFQKPDLDQLELQARESGAYMIKVIDCRFRTIVYYIDPATDDPDLFALFDQLHLEFPDHDATLFIAVFRKEADQDGNPTSTQ
jgi:hypothetical protein